MTEQEEKQPTVFRDSGTMVTSSSLAFFEEIKDMLDGKVVKLMAERGTPERVYNTRVYTDRDEEIWMSGFTCGKEHAGSLGLCELIVMIGWDKYVPRDEITRIVLTNNSFRMEFRPREDEPKKRIYLVEYPKMNGSKPQMKRFMKKFSDPRLTCDNSECMWDGIIKPHDDIVLIHYKRRSAKDILHDQLGLHDFAQVFHVECLPREIQNELEDTE